ncbi:MAG: hypothetical protein IJW19_06360 [Clostridia bacterium]|nr:hypothetical protein [Clostridia bacterium]
MKLGEIKLEALMLCFANPELGVDIDNEEVFLDTLNNLKYDENYKNYMNAMPGAINRCFSSIEHKGILPTKAVNLTGSSLLVYEGLVRLDLNELAKDFCQLESITLISNGVVVPHMPFTRLGENTVLLQPIGAKDEYVIIYGPKIPRIKISTPESYEIDLPEDILALVPYFIKGDIMRIDDANEAAEARNIFEAMCQEIYTGEKNYQSEVKTVYKQEYSA